MEKFKLTGALMAAVIFVSCHTSQKFRASTSEDKPLYAAINELNKRPTNGKAQSDLKVFYSQAVDRHENALAVYRNSRDNNRFDRMINELNSLQHIANSIMATPAAVSLVNPKSYLHELQVVKEEAAEVYYNDAIALMEKGGRVNTLQSYETFKKVNNYVNGYKDANRLMKEAYEISIINVVINPIEEDNVFFSNMSSWGNDFRYRPEDYQQSLVRDLGGRNGNQLAARFFTDRDARRDRIDADWMIDIRWRNVDAIRTTPHQYNRQVSRNVQVGSDTTGKPVYQTVYANLRITQRTFSVRGDLDYRITDVNEKSSIDYGALTDNVSWTESYATYSGDSRALSQDEWSMVNNSRSNYNSPTRSDVLNSLMRKMYPDLRRRIQNSIN